MQPVIRLPQSAPLREKILAAFKHSPPFAIEGKAEGSLPDVAIGRGDELKEAENAFQLEIVDDEQTTAQLQMQPGRYVIAHSASEETWRTAIMLAIQIAKLRRQAAISSQQAETYFDQAHTDALTGLANRRGWDASLDQLPEGDDTPNVCLILDIDNFKGCNDTQGHEFGDRVLRAAGAALKSHLRQQDLAARIGGDEFAAWLSDVSPALTGTIIERIREQVAHSIRLDLGEGAPTISIGASVAVRRCPKEMLAGADQALYEAKRNGRDQSHVVYAN